jgi:CDP-diacylglycerol--inositol 3-phosphatidyltransferase
LFLICAGNELFFVALYLMKWVHTPIARQSSSPYLSTITYPFAMAVISFPIFFLKNVINMVQLWKASKILVGVDLATRRDATAARSK